MPKAKPKPKKRTAVAPKRKRPPATVKGYAALAERYGVSTRTIQTWISKGLPHSGPPRARSFKVAETDKWVASFRQAPGVCAESIELNRRLKEAKLKGHELLVKQLELRLEATASELLPREGWEQFRSTLLSCLDKLRNSLPDLTANLCCRECAEKVAARMKMELDSWRHTTADDLEIGPLEKHA